MSYFGKKQTNAEIRSAAYQMLREKGVLKEHASRMADQIAAKSEDSEKTYILGRPSAKSEPGASAEKTEGRPYLPLPHCFSIEE